MKINIFYKHANSNGGVPSDIRDLFINLNNKINCSIFSFGDFHAEVKYTDILINKGFISLIIFIFTNKEKIAKELNIIVGFYIFNNVILSLVFKIAGINYHLLPLSQINEYSKKNKLFYASPIIHNGNLLVKDIKEDLLYKNVSLYLKDLYYKTFGFFLFSNAKQIWCVSDYEKVKIEDIYTLKNKKLIYYGFGVNTIKKKLNYRFDYKYINIVYWGRIDYKNKGLDRLIYMLSKNQQYLVLDKFKFHIIGPDYNNGFKKVKNEILSNSLEEILILYNDNEIKEIDLGGLRNSDGCVLLSKWEGFPRVLREASYFNLPALISPETQFADIHLKKLNPISSVIDFNNSDEIQNNITFLRFLESVKINKLNKSRENNLSVVNDSWHIEIDNIVSQLYKIR